MSAQADALSPQGAEALLNFVYIVDILTVFFFAMAPPIFERIKQFDDKINNCILNVTLEQIIYPQFRN